MTKRTNVVELIEQATNLGEKIKEHDVIKLELVTSWLDETLEIIKNMGKAVDEVEERLEILEEIMEE